VKEKVITMDENLGLVTERIDSTPEAWASK